MLFPLVTKGHKQWRLLLQCFPISRVEKRENFYLQSSPQTHYLILLYYLNPTVICDP